MKIVMKKYVKMAFVAAFVAIAGNGVYVNQKTEAVLDLTLANVEALAGGEWGTGFNCRWADANYWFCTPLGDGLGCPALCKYSGCVKELLCTPYA